MEDKIEIFKALSDKNRLLILDMLSCGELCACDIIKGLDLTQPTISHHMKILKSSGLVNGHKKGKWMIYSINEEVVDDVLNFIKHITTYKEDCICNTVKKNSCCDK
ncbi:MAG: winged helix-turn-helix transcriptional regulator [Firmicutes bacterium]|nr:winged helix-turn-helix transcriptional regulator [Bacillota bacterium]